MKTQSNESKKSTDSVSTACSQEEDHSVKRKDTASELLEVSERLLFNENVPFFSNYKNFNDLLNTRVKFLDWLTSVTSKLKIGSSTIFMAFNILDKLLFKLNFKMTKEEMYFTGVLCLNIATKYCEVFKFRLGDLRRYLLNDAYTEKQVIDGELVILKMLNFCLPQNHFENFLNALLNQLWQILEFSVRMNSAKTNIISLCLYYYRIVLCDYKTTRGSKLTYLYMALVVFTLAKYKEYDRNFTECDEVMKLCFLHLKSTSKVKKLVSQIDLLVHSYTNGKTNDQKNLKKGLKELIMSF